MKQEYKTIYSNSYSGIRCRRCPRMTTERELTESVRRYEKPLCQLCCRLEYYRLRVHPNED